MAQFRILSPAILDADASFQQPTRNLPEHVTLDSPAIDVMTDLSKVSAETVSANLSAADAEEKMIASGVRLLFVTSPLNRVIGIVTAKDVGGERIMQFVTDSNTPRQEVIVRDIMTPRHKIEVLEMGDVATARVGDLVATLKRMGRQHALVIDRNARGTQTIRGVLSASQIGRQLGQAIETTDFAGSFAELAGAG